MTTGSGKILKKIDDLGIADNTIVIYTHRQRAAFQRLARCGGDALPQREELQLGRRLPCPGGDPLAGQDRAGSVTNQIVSGLDWFPTLVAAAGDADIKDKLKAGFAVGGKTYKVHLDGYNQLPMLTGQTAGRPAQGVLLLQRRRPDGRDALRALEGRLHGAARRRLRRLARALRDAARAEAVRPAHGPVRARRRRAATPTTTGSYGASSCWCRPRAWRGSSSRPSANSRRGSGRTASTWMACCADGAADGATLLAGRRRAQRRRTRHARRPEETRSVTAHQPRPGTDVGALPDLTRAPPSPSCAPAWARPSSARSG